MTEKTVKRFYPSSELAGEKRVLSDATWQTLVYDRLRQITPTISYMKFETLGPHIESLYPRDGVQIDITPELRSAQGLHFARPIISKDTLTEFEWVIKRPEWVRDHTLLYLSRNLGPPKGGWVIVRCLCHAVYYKNRSSKKAKINRVLVTCTRDGNIDTTRLVEEVLRGHISYYCLWNFLNQQVLHSEKFRLDLAAKAGALAGQVRADQCFAERCVEISYDGVIPPSCL